MAGELPDPSAFGESWDHPSATHGDFHARPGYLPGAEQLVETPQIQGLVTLGEHGRMPGIRFVPPRSWSSGRPGGPPRFVVIHYTAGSESVTAAEDGVAYDQRRTDGTSAHFYTDRDSIIQCVDADHRSHTAKYYGNLWGIHIEQCGTVQTRAQWLDAASRATIRNTAKAAAWALTQYGLPLARLVNAQVRSGRGVCGHVDCTNGFPEDNGSHTDPGTAYPWDVLIADIKAELAGQEDDMELTDSMQPHVGFSTNVGDVLASAYSYAKQASGTVAGVNAKVEQLLLAAGEEVQRDAAEAARDAELLAAMQSVQAGDPEVLAGLLGEHLTPALLDALAARLGS